VKARVKVNVSQWAWGDGDESHALAGGTHTLEGKALSKDFARALAAAAAADPGTLEIVSSDDAFKSAVKAEVESDHESAKVLAKAQENGSWYESNLVSQIANFEGLAAEARAMSEGAEGGRKEELEGAAVRAEHARRQAEEALASTRGEA
jgi:hypothetical protein